MSTQVQGNGAFRLFYDQGLSVATPYHSSNDYFIKAKDRMDRTFDLIKKEVPGGRIVDIGASPFYLLYRAQQAGARECHGIYFANDTHPLRDKASIYSEHGSIHIKHANIETDNLPFEDDGVDVVTACEVLEHLDYFPHRFSSEIRRVLKPGGVLCITVPNVSSIGNILKLVLQKNIFMKYRSDHTGRHKHEYTQSELKAFIDYLGMDLVSSGFLPSPTSHKTFLRPIYRLMARLPGLRLYSPVVYVMGRQKTPKPTGAFGRPPEILYDEARSIED